MKRRRPHEKHGHAKLNSPEYRVWSQMIMRCTNQRAPNFNRYGGAGIGVCARWHDSFVAFLADMGPRPVGTTLDRIDNSLGYAPDNCRWATYRQQAHNRKTTRFVTIGGETLCVTDWARRAGISDTAMLYRIRRGLAGEALLRPSHHRKSLRAGQLPLLSMP